MKPFEHGHLRVSQNQRFLEHEDGTPFFWLADTAWELFHRLTRSEIEHYLTHRAQQGFNVIQAVCLAELDGLGTPNREGRVPLIDNDPTRPDLSPGGYWDLVDAAVKMADERGLYIGLLPTWGDKVVEATWADGPVIFNEENARIYGRFIGERYGRSRNIIWIMGGDRDPAQHKGVFDAMALGIRETESFRHMMTYHPNGGSSSSTEMHDYDWLDLNMMQSGHWWFDLRPDLMMEADYKREPVKPSLDGEPNYENHRAFRSFSEFKDLSIPPLTAYHVRRASYQSVFAGGCGVTYGCHAVWQMAQPSYQPVNHPIGTWRQSLSLPGAIQVRHLKNLILSRPYMSRVPDQSLIEAGLGENEETARGTRCGEGSYAMVYLPFPRTIEICFDNLAKELVAWWFDPRSGTATQTDVASTFESPTAEDWVLVLDDKSRNFAHPGTP